MNTTKYLPAIYLFPKMIEKLKLGKLAHVDVLDIDLLMPLFSPDEIAEFLLNHSQFTTFGNPLPFAFLPQAFLDYWRTQTNNPEANGFIEKVEQHLKIIEISQEQFINQFPFDFNLGIKSSDLDLVKPLILTIEPATGVDDIVYDKKLKDKITVNVVKYLLNKLPLHEVAKYTWFESAASSLNLEGVTTALPEPVDFENRTGEEDSSPITHL